MKIANFAAIQGNLIIENGIIKYLEAEKDDESKIKKYTLGIIRASTSFSNGVITFQVKVSNPLNSFFVVVKTTDNKDLFIGYSRIIEAFFIRYANDRKNENLLDFAGKIKNYKMDEWIAIKIKVIGSTIDLYVNDVQMCTANISLKESPLEFELNGQGEIIIKDVIIEKEQKTAFVVMQFTQEYNDLYTEVIQPTIEKFDMKCIRADDIYASTPILSDIINEISSASIVIADITPDNPNVFYELGYAHAIKKPTIILAEKQRSKLPFDLSGFRTIIYDNSIIGKRKVENTLISYIEKISKT